MFDVSDDECFSWKSKCQHASFQANKTPEWYSAYSVNVWMDISFDGNTVSFSLSKQHNVYSYILVIHNMVKRKKRKRAKELIVYFRSKDSRMLFENDSKANFMKSLEKPTDKHGNASASPRYRSLWVRFFFFGFALAEFDSVDVTL